jgi:heat shock protein HslJ
MDDLERTFREGLRAAVATKPPLGDIDLESFPGLRADARKHRAWRARLAAAAAVVLVAGVAAGGWYLRSTVVIPAVPLAPPTSTPVQSAPTPTAGPADGLAGMRWVASNVGGTAVVGGTADRPWLEFSAAVDGRRDVSGSDGCHRLRGQSEGTADFINLTGWDLIVRPCGSVEHQQQQSRFVSALEAVTRLRVSGTDLRLMRADGTVALRFDGTPTEALAGPGDEPTPTTPPATRIFTPDPNAEENQVHDYPQVRYRNDSTATFERVLLKWSDGGSDSAGIDIQPGQYSGYVEMGYVRLNPYVRVSVKGKQYEWNPPNPGRKLTRGNVTYVLDLVDGLLTVTAEVQD